MDKIRIGLIGAGGIARSHVQGYLEVRDRAEVTAVADVRREMASKASETLGGAEVYDDWQALLERAAVDAVDICLPHDLHTPVAVAAAQTGKHVLIEKPIARTLQEADDIISAARGANVTLMVCHDRRFDPTFIKIKELVDAGVIGKLLCLRLDHNQYINLTPDSWISQKERLGGGAIMSCLVHQFDAMRWFAGEAVQVGCLSITLPERMEGEIIGVVPIRFASGAIGETLINWNMQGHRLPGGLWYEGIWLSGTEGNLHNCGGINLLRYFTGIDRYEQIPVERPPAGYSHRRAIAHFVDCLIAGTEPVTNGAEARAALEIAMGAYASETTGEFANLPLRY